MNKEEKKLTVTATPFPISGVRASSAAQICRGRRRLVIQTLIYVFTDQTRDWAKLGLALAAAYVCFIAKAVGTR